LQPALVILIAYLLGAIPTAYLAGRLVKKGDIRRMGGGNMGALNATRELGSLAGAGVLAVDVAKGCAAVLIARACGLSPTWIYMAAFLAVVGHCWPVYLKFKGGKGAATALGVLATLAPWSFLCGVPIGLAVIMLTSNVTLTMAVMFVFMPLFLWLFHQPFHLIIFLMALFVFLGVRYAGTAQRNLKSTGWRDFLVDKKYTPWQRPRKNRDKPGDP
jgi:acyl phosphate:glycerol-3-phosphate acyltransferase